MPRPLGSLEIVPQPRPPSHVTINSFVPRMFHRRKTGTVKCVGLNDLAHHGRHFAISRCTQTFKTLHASTHGAFEGVQRRVPVVQFHT